MILKKWQKVFVHFRICVGPHFVLDLSENAFLNDAGYFSDTINKVGSLPDEYFTTLNGRNYVLV